MLAALASFVLVALLVPKPLASSTAPVGRAGRVTGFKIPRFVSLGTDRARMQTGDRVSVTGQVDDADLFDKRELNANSLVVLSG